MIAFEERICPQITQITQIKSKSFEVSGLYLSGTDLKKFCAGRMIEAFKQP